MSSAAKRARRRAWRSRLRAIANGRAETRHIEREADRWGIPGYVLDRFWGDDQVIAELVREERRRTELVRDLLAVRVSVLNKVRVGAPHRIELVRYLVSKGEQLPNEPAVALAVRALSAAHRRKTGGES